MWIYTTSNTRNKRRYTNDINIEDPSFSSKPYKPKRCMYYQRRHCWFKDPVSNVYIPLRFIAEDKYICANCETREKMNRWFYNLQQTEIPTVLPQFHKLKGRIVPKGEQIWDFGPPNDDPCWGFYNIYGAY
jgi:hypothetical protein